MEESKREMRFTPDFPARTARQKASFPVPLGLTTPIPVMTTRGSIFFEIHVLLEFHVRCEEASAKSRERAARSWDNNTDAAGIVHFRALLQDQVHLLQLRFGRIFARGI